MYWAPGYNLMKTWLIPGRTLNGANKYFFKKINHTVICKCLYKGYSYLLRPHKVVGTTICSSHRFSHLNLKATPQGRHSSLKTLSL